MLRARPPFPCIAALAFACAVVLSACTETPAPPRSPTSVHAGCETPERCDARCLQGDASACGMMGIAATAGAGVQRDPARALTYLRRGCEGGDGRSCTHLGYAYIQGLGVEPDQRKAAGYFDQGCRRGFALGCKDLGTMYRNGRGVPHDDARALTLFGQACDAGTALGCMSLALMMPDELVPEDRAARALPLLVHDCDPRENPDPRVCTAAARLYAAGRGAAKDRGRASALFAAACKRGDPIACKAP